MSKLILGILVGIQLAWICSHTPIGLEYLQNVIERGAGGSGIAFGVATILFTVVCYFFFDSDNPYRRAFREWCEKRLAQRSSKR